MIFIYYSAFSPVLGGLSTPAGCTRLNCSQTIIFKDFADTHYKLTSHLVQQFSCTYLKVNHFKTVFS